MHPYPPTDAQECVVCEVRGSAGLITLNRARALNALSLPMIRAISAALRVWRSDPAIRVVAMRGSMRSATDGAAAEPFGAFCAGGDIRFFHQAALSADPQLEDFFTEEYQLNHLIHRYPKPCIAFMDGVVMGGGMGLAQGASLRIVTERTKMAMPETAIGLFPDVGGGWFLSRCKGHLGEYLALTGVQIGAAQALAAGLADVGRDSGDLHALWDGLAHWPLASGPTGSAAEHWLAGKALTMDHHRDWPPPAVDRHFGLASVAGIVASLEEAAESDAWANDTAKALRKQSPLMLCVSLEQIRRARKLGLEDALRMERDLMRHCFHTVHLGRYGTAGETVEGIRALAVDKDRSPKWNPQRIEDVTPHMVDPFFHSPWPATGHPLRDLA